MKVIPSTGPQSVRQSNSTGVQRAVQAFEASAAAQNTQTTPVVNPTNVLPEELGAVRPAGLSNSNEPSEAPKAETGKAAEEPLSSQYAILARREKALRAERQKFLADRQAFDKAREEALKPKAPAFDESRYVSKDKLQEDPFSVLTDLGLSYEELTNKALNAPTPEQVAQQQYIKKLEARLAQIDEKLEKTTKTFEERDREALQQTKATLNAETKRLVELNPNFEMIKDTGSHADVVELIERTFEADGYLMSVEEAAQAVEDHLVEEAIKVTKMKKIQQRLQSAATPAEQKTTEAPKQQQLKTLTNNVGSNRQLSAKERAILAFRGELK